MRNHKLHHQLLSCCFAMVLICLSVFSQSAEAACPIPGIAGTTVPIVYQECFETVDTNYDNNDSFQITTSANVQVGDYLVMAVVVERSHTLSITTTAPTGWTAITVPVNMANRVNPDGQVTLGVYRKTVTQAGAETVTVSRAAGGNNKHAVGWIMRFSNTYGQDTSNAARNAILESNGANNAVSPAVTTGEVNSLVLRLTGIDDDDTGAAQDSNIYGTSSTGFLNTPISMQESAGGGNTVTAIAAYHLKAAIGNIGTSTTTSTTGGNEEYVSYTMTLRPRPYFTFTKPASGSACSVHTISIAARNTNGAVNTGFTETITLSTSTGAGQWAKATTGDIPNGTLTGGEVGNGGASYTFTGSDSGTIDLLYYNTTVGSVNFDIVSTNGHRELKTLANDSNLTLTACPASAITNTQQTCNVFQGNGGTINFSHTGAGTGLPSSATANRMVVVMVGGESPATPDLTPATATFNGVPMQSLTFRREDSGAENGTQIFAINHAALPPGAGNYNVVISGPAADAAACAFTLTGVSQAYPAGNGAGLPVNNNSIVNNDVITTQITTVGANSYVLAGVSNGNPNSYTHSLAGPELEDTQIGGGGATFSVSGATIASAGLLNVTDTGAGVNRQTQVVASFRPATTGGFFSISHAGSGGVCGATSITIAAITALGVTDPTYTGSVTITAGGSGNWSASPSANLSFSNGTPNNGTATYTFDGTDGGDVELYFTPAGAGTVNFNVVDGGDPSRTVFPFFDPNLVIENCEIRISHDLGGNNCTVESITFSIVTASNQPVNNYVGTLNLSTVTTPGALSDKGTWSKQAGDTGTLVDTTIKDGIAAYTFPASNNGIVTLNFAETLLGSINFNATATGGLTVNGSFDPLLVVSACKFRVAYTGGNSTDVCSLKEVTITAVDDVGVQITNFAGQVNITTTSNKGTWTKSGVQPGTLTDLLPNDGSASYTFIAGAGPGGDNGDVTLLLNVPEVGVGTLKVDVVTVSGSIQVDTNPTYDPTLSIQLCQFRIVETDGQLSTCSAEELTITVYSPILAGPAVDYTGKIDLSTLNNNGSWQLETGLGDFDDPVLEDGSASYTFDAGDDGVVVLQFFDEATEDTDINVVAELEANFREDSSFDPTLEVTPCLPVVLSTQCYNGDSQANAISVPAQNVTEDSRMLLLWIYSETPMDTTTVTLTDDSLNTYAMTEYHFVTAADVRMEVWGILGADLPDTAETLDVDFNGAPWTASFGTRNPGFCAVSLESVKQETPLLTAPPEDGPINGVAGNAINDPSLDVTTTENNAILFSVIGAGENGATDTVTDLENVLWDLDSGNATAPDSANFNGAYEIIPVAGTATASENTSGGTDRLAHIALALSPVKAGDPYATGYVPVKLFETLAGNMSYRTIGRSMREFPNQGTPPYTEACTMLPSTTSNLPLPAIGTTSIESAYLYWAGSGSTADIDNKVFFGPVGSTVEVTADGVFEIDGATGDPDVDFFVGYKQVKNLIGTGASQDYEVSGLDVQTGAPWSLNQTCLAGWGLVVVFENATAEPYVNVVNLFHGFQPFQNSSITLVPRNFRMATPNVVNNVPRGLITHITFEGDSSINSGTEEFELQKDPAGLTFLPLRNIYNGVSSAYNDTVSFPDYYSATVPKPYILQTNQSYGTDIDTFYIGGAVEAADPLNPSNEEVLFPFGDVAAEQITTRYSAGGDLVMLAGEFIAVTNADLADLEVFVTSSGTFKINSDATASFLIDVVNNGNNAASNGYATGTVILSGIMPTGFTIDSVVADPLWVCDVTPNTTFLCTFNIEAWTDPTPSTTAFQLKDGLSLPQVEFVVDIGGDTSFPLLSNTAYLSARIAHFATPIGCAIVGDGLQPDPTVCTKALQFDNVNDLNKNTIDIDDLDVKQVNNNNVDRGSVIVTGVITDLEMDISVVGVLQQGQPGQYLLRVDNNGPDDTTKVMTVTAAFDPDAAPADGPFVVPGWSCSVTSATMTCTSTAPISNGGFSNILVDIPVVNKAEGEFASASAAVTPGDKNFDTDLSNNADTVDPEIVGLIVPITEKFLMSATEATTLGSNLVGFGPDDLVLFDPATNEAELYLDTSSVGGVTDINAVHLLPNGWIAFSASTGGTFLTVDYDDEDIILYDPILGEASLLFDGSEANKFSGGAAAADIDAIYIDYNDSWDTDTWELYISTTTASSLPGVGAFEDEDMVVYTLGAGTAATPAFFDGSDANKFAATDGNIDGFFIPYDDPDLYYLTTSLPSATIDTNETFELDDLVTYDNSLGDGLKATQVFDGEQSDGFTPFSASLGIDALHVVQEGYYGHFSITTTDGEVCSPGIVTIRKHKALGHTVDLDYEGSIIITDTSGSGTWTDGGSNSGFLDDKGAGIAHYTFHPDDDGEVVLFLSQPAEEINININVTNGIAKELVSEDDLITINTSLIAVNYRDEFGTSSYSSNYGSSAWTNDWTEVGDDGDEDTGDVCISCLGGAPSGRLHMKDTDGDLPYIYREIAFDYDANTGVNPLMLSFKWSRSNGTTTDYMGVAYSQNVGEVGESWTPVGNYGNAVPDGPVTQQTVNINLTAAGVTALDGDQLWIRFQILDGLALDYITLDDVDVSTSSASDCSPGLLFTHYHIIHSGSVVSCLATNITFEAHDDSHNPVVAGAGNTLIINTESAKGSWNLVSGLTSSPVANNGYATYVFQTGETGVTIPFNYTEISTDTESVEFTLIDDNLIGEAVENNLTVTRAGLRFFNDTAGTTVWPTMVAGMNSFDYTGQNLIVQAIKTSDSNPLACEPLFTTPTVVPIQLVFECENPASCGDVSTQVTLPNIAGPNNVVNTVNSNGTAGIAPASEVEYIEINIPFSNYTDGTFGAYSAGEIQINYPDVGELQIHGRYDIRLDNNLGGTLSGNYVNSNSPSFVVRPFGLDVDFDTNDRRTNTDSSLAVDHNSNAYAKAGETIDTTVRAVIWDAADDTVINATGALGSDGIPDFEADLADNVVAINFGKETNFAATYNVALEVITVVPIALTPNLGVPGGVVGSLVQAGDFTTFVGGESTNSVTIAFNEVGIFDVRAELTNNVGAAINYLNTEPVEGGARNVGRITPAYFDLDMVSTMIDERPNAVGVSSFTYMGEEFGVTLGLQAKHTNGTNLNNYLGNFAKLNDLGDNSPQYVFRAFEDDGSGADTDWSNPLTPDTDRLGSLTNLSFDSAWASGEATLSGTLVFSRETDSGTPGDVPDGPLTLTIAVDLDDGDDVFDQPDRHIDAGNEADPFTLHFVDTNEFRYGRMVLLNAYGSELAEEDGDNIGKDVSMRMLIEYWNETDMEWQVNDEDDITQLDIQHLSAVYDDDLADNLSLAEVNAAKNSDVSVNSGVTTLSDGQTLEAGNNDLPFYFTAPGEDKEGAVIMQYDLTTATGADLEFLLYDWRSVGEEEDDTQDDIYTDSPRALIEFGTYQGNSRIINWQELFLDE